MGKHPRHLAALSSFKAPLRAVFCLGLSLLLSSHAAPAAPPAQSAGATLSGTVFDEDGAVVEGAGVTAFNPATGMERRATTNRGCATHRQWEREAVAGRTERYGT